MNNDVVFTCPNKNCKSNNHYYGKFDKKQLQLEYSSLICKFCHEEFELNQANFNYEVLKNKGGDNKMPSGTKPKNKSETKDFPPCIFLRMSKDNKYLLGHFSNPPGKSIIANMDEIDKLVDGKIEYVRCVINVKEN